MTTVDVWLPRLALALLLAVLSAFAGCRSAQHEPATPPGSSIAQTPLIDLPDADSSAAVQAAIRKFAELDPLPADFAYYPFRVKRRYDGCWEVQLLIDRAFGGGVVEVAPSGAARIIEAHDVPPERLAGAPPVCGPQASSAVGTAAIGAPPRA